LAIRIYALAKQLRVEHKKLVDVCKEAGIAGKGSALASLSDEEVELIKEHLRRPGKAARPAPEQPTGPVRQDPTTVIRSRVPVIERKPSPLPTDVTPDPAGASATTQVAESPPDSPSTPPPLPAPFPPTITPATPAAAVQRGDYIGPGGMAIPSRVPVLGEKPELAAKSPRPEGASGPAPPPKSGPAIKLAPMPESKQPAAKKPAEPAPQRPDLKLPPDAIRASKAGSKPLADHLREHEKDKKRKAAGKKAGPGRPAEQPDVPPLDDGSGLGEKDRGRRGGRSGAVPKDLAATTLGGREQRQLRRKRTAAGRRRRSDEEESPRQVRRLRRTGNVSTAAPRKGNVVVDLPCTVKSFAEALGLPVAQVLGKALELGMMLNITASLDAEVAELLAEGLGAEVNFRRAASLEEKLIETIEEQVDAEESLQPRPPVVTFLGHVDHGKTSLLDRILGLDVVSTERGGITQHIRAYRIETPNGAVAFVDTPGHEAFTAMRARGANCTDIAVLVVAADDGVMPQTEEAISHAKAAGVPIVVALNKIDLPGVNPDRAFQDLAARELLPSEWGGDTEVIRTSAITGEGVDELLDTLLTVAELHEYRANPDRAATGVCLEAEVQQGRGVVCKVLVQKGTLHVGDVVVCGSAHGRIKAMYDTLKPKRRLKEAGPSTPVHLTGLDVAPGAGDRFHVLADVSEARQIAEQRAAACREQELGGVRPEHVTLENLFARLEEQDEVQTLNIILRADVRGSIEAIRKELTKLEHPEVQIKILQASVGGITEADVTLADASDAVIIGFNVVPEEGARVLADRRGVQVRRYDIIYQVTEDLKAALEGMLKPEEREEELGRALVQRTFTISRLGTIAGCRVLAGNIHRDSRIRVIRENRVIGDYPLDSLRREKDDAREVREGLECGIKLSGFNDLKEGDVLEAYRMQEVARTF
jgi:translation initiation factor IF-2